MLIVVIWWPWSPMCHQKLDTVVNIRCFNHMDRSHWWKTQCPCFVVQHIMLLWVVKVKSYCDGNWLSFFKFEGIAIHFLKCLGDCLGEWFLVWVAHIPQINWMKAAHSNVLNNSPSGLLLIFNAAGQKFVLYTFLPFTLKNSSLFEGWVKKNTCLYFSINVNLNNTLGRKSFEVCWHMNKDKCIVSKSYSSRLHFCSCEWWKMQTRRIRFWHNTLVLLVCIFVPVNDVRIHDRSKIFSHFHLINILKNESFQL